MRNVTAGSAWPSRAATACTRYPGEEKRGRVRVTQIVQAGMGSAWAGAETFFIRPAHAPPAMRTSADRHWPGTKPGFITLSRPTSYHALNRLWFAVS